MNVSTKDFYYVCDDTLSPEFCEGVIEKFKVDDRKQQGTVGEGTVIKEIKNSQDLNITKLEGWKKENEVFRQALTAHERKFITPEWNSDCVFKGFHNVTDSGFQIQETQPGEGYVWHFDAQSAQYTMTEGIRWGVYIWYLNDVEEDGYTEFIDGTKIQPKAGRLLMFPATWTFIHRGFPPKNQTKYIATGWLHYK